jgi:hypothetical protein
VNSLAEIKKKALKQGMTAAIFEHRITVSELFTFIVQTEAILNTELIISDTKGNNDKPLFLLYFLDLNRILPDTNGEFG